MTVTEPSLGATGWNAWGHDVTTIVNSVQLGATANSPDATLLARANHTGTQTASTISDFSEAVDDRVGSLLTAGSNVTLTYNDVGNTLTVAAGGGSGGYATVAEEGSSLTQRATLNFVGRSVTAADNAGSTRTDVTISDEPLVHTVGNSGSTLTVDASSTSGYIKTITLNANCTFTFSGATAGRASTLELVLTQDATGSRIATWPASVKWAAGTAPTLSIAASAVDRIVFTSYNGGTTWYGDLIGKAYA